MQEILVLFAHPYPHRSRVNRPLREAVEDLPRVRVHDLYETYPDFFIDVKREQALLRRAALVVLQHPFYWYSAPALLKQWLDVVLEYGFAIGREGTALHGKSLLSVVSTGHRAEAYGPEGKDRYTMEELLRPFEQTARHCGMEYLPPLVVHGVRHLSDADIDAHCERYRRRLLAFQHGTSAEERTHG